MVSRNSNMIAAVSFVAVAAPFFGGAVGETLGWRALFAVMGGAGAGALVLAGVAFRRGLPGDRRKPDSDKIRLSRAAAHLVRSRTFILNTAMMALALGSIYFFLGAAPYVSTILLGFSPSETGAWLLVVSLGLPAGALISSVVGPRLGMRRAMITGSGIMTVAVAIQAALNGAGLLSPFTVFVPMCAHCIGMTLLLSNAQSAAAVAVPGLTGSAVGLSGAVQFAGASLLAFFGAWMIEYNHWPFVVFLTNAFFCLAILLLTLFKDAQVPTER
jgi:DHA1 family bicyclomycin/chloramphenicol resistance-like MFS transporter